MNDVNFMKSLFVISCFTSFTLSLDQVSSGNYLIEGCNSRASLVQSLLQRTNSTIQPLIQSQDTNAPPYKAFFGGANSSEVKRVFSAISTAPMGHIEGSLYRPALRCVDAAAPPPDLPGKTMLNICLEPPGQMMMLQRNTITICPSFWETSGWPGQGGRDVCGTVNTAESSMTTPGRGQTRFLFLIAALANLYMDQSKSPGSQVFSADDCIALPPSQKLVNAMSYAYYAISKFPQSLALLS
ncbi:hypothetical protein MMC14_008876 [Varicellaria rhodocarpa]|nr:hypothetical protein [Varicellaria rhodocarpa]